MTDPITRFHRLQQRYRDGEIPWDQDLPPPEVMAIADVLPPGRALDLDVAQGAPASIWQRAAGLSMALISFLRRLRGLRSESGALARRVECASSHRRSPAFPFCANHTIWSSMSVACME